MQNVKLLIFDLDNTLINYGGVTQKAWTLACQEGIDKYKVNVDVKDMVAQIICANNAVWEDDKKRPKGNFSFDELRRSIVIDAFNHLGINHSEMITWLVSHYAYYKHEAVYVFDDVHETLKELKRRGYKLALLTNGDSAFQREKLKRFDLEKRFDGIFIDGEQGVGKPEKEAYDHVLNQFQVQPDEACMIGDHYVWEVVAPKSYGLKTIWVNRGNLGVKGNEEIKPDNIIYNIGELLDIFHASNIFNSNNMI